MRYVVLSFFLYLIPALSALHEPLMGDETANLDTAERLFQEPERRVPTGHPPLYSLMVASMHRVFGSHPVVYRALNIVCFAAVLLLSYLLALRVYKHDPPKAKAVAGISVLALALFPAAVWPSLLVDIDTSILTPLGLAVILLLTAESYSLRHILWLVLACTLLLAAKLQSGPLLAVGHGLYLLARRRYRDLAIIMLVWLLAVGLTLAATWIFAKTLFPHDPERIFADPFVHAFKTIISHGITGRLSAPSTYKDPIVLAFWLNPFVLALLIAGLLHMLRRFIRTRTLTPPDLLICILIPCLGVPTLVMGLHYGMPKYQFPFVPVLLIVAVERVVDRLGPSTIRSSWAWILPAALYYLLPGDLVLHLGYELKRAVVQHAARAGILAAAWRVLLYLLPLPALGLLLRRRSTTPRPWLTAAALLAAGSTLGSLTLETLAPYQKVGLYGGRDTRRATEAIWGACREGLHGYVLHEFVYEIQRRDKRLGTSCLTILWPTDLASVETYLGALDRVKPDFLVTGLPINSLNQLRNVFPDPRVQSYLQRGYVQRPIGDFTMWIRSSSPPADASTSPQVLDLGGRPSAGEP